MAKNYNIQTESFRLAQNASDSIAIGAVVPDGMTRYVTFIRVTPLIGSNDEGSKVYFCSAATVAVATTDAQATALQKMIISIGSASTVGDKVVAVPASPSTEHPLFTIASAAFLTAHLACAATMSSSVQVFVQYYDE